MDTEKQLLESMLKQMAEVIKKGMEAKGLNKKQFANLMNVQPSIITRWLSGKHNFTIRTLIQIENKLGIKVINVEKPNKVINLVMKVSSTTEFNSNHAA